MKPHNPFLSTLLGAAALHPISGRTVPLPTHLYTIPSSYATGAPQIQTVQAQGPLDDYKLPGGTTNTSFDWWYFDAVAATPTNKSSIVVQFVTGDTFGAGGPLSNVVSVSGIFPNGTLFSVSLPATADVVVKTVGQGSESVWPGTGCAWAGRPDLSVYTVTVSNKEAGIHGVMTMHATTPAHYPHDLTATVNASEVLAGNFGWANAIPDSVATACFTINGSTLEFQGSGYHDKNWGAMPLPALITSWYWGHASLGSLSLVWFYFTSRSGEVSTSAYLSKDGTVLSLSSVEVRPFGANATYPPKTNADMPAGFNITVDAGFNGVWKFDAVAEAASGQLPVEFYSRWVGEVTGGLEGCERSESGTGLWEWMHFLE